MIDVRSLDRDSILGEPVFEELFSMNDVSERTRLEIRLIERAKDLGRKSDFEKLLRAYKKIDRETDKKEAVQGLDGWTNFPGDEYDRLRCGSWICNAEGIYAQNDTRIQAIACRHPILPVRRFENIETGAERVTLAFYRRGKWKEVTVEKGKTASARSIVDLSNLGIGVTSENAKLLVRYLEEVESLNDFYIPVSRSTGKLGWHKEDIFVPFDEGIELDDYDKYKQLFDSLKPEGDYGTWLGCVRQIRQSWRIEPRFLMAASFASVLIRKTGQLPFICDLWGETEGGKTVALMLAASIWANPGENCYIGDFKTTEVALEVKANILNHLPMLLDDTSKVSKRIRDNFEGVVYDICSGKGKSRSNKLLGINTESHWQNVTICNGERPLQSYVEQGGALNRILELKSGYRKIFGDDAPKIADTIKANYGHAGRRFIEVVKSLGTDKIRSMMHSYQSMLMGDSRMDKQAMSLAVVLTADQIATDYIFNDGIYIELEEALECLTDRSEVSDNVRCYNYLIDKIAMNPTRFDDKAACEQWGVLDDGYAYFYGQAFEQLCKDGGFQAKSFLSWAAVKEVIEKGNDGRVTKLKKIGGKPVRCIWLKLAKADEEDQECFIKLSEDDLKALPFS